MARITVIDRETGERGWFDPALSEAFTDIPVWVGGNEHGSASRSQWVDEVLYRTPGGRWVLRVDAHRLNDGPVEHRWLADDQAREWLIASGRGDEVAALLPETLEERGPGKPAIGTQVKATIPDEHLVLIDAMVARGEARSRSEAVRVLVGRALGSGAV